MKEYLATFEMNNGCKCCRETWTVEREAEFEDGAPYDEVRKYFENMEHAERVLLHIQRTDISPSDIDELQDEVSRLKKELEALQAGRVEPGTRGKRYIEVCCCGDCPYIQSFGCATAFRDDYRCGNQEVQQSQKIDGRFLTDGFPDFCPIENKSTVKPEEK